ncbi:MAG: 4-hydroxy-tetrahydrodipicolinate reductase [Clostridia bacterium]|nr:4-hydroxy-tetrahydrodipicolinate reductase [Clostridia bacterium]
MIKVLINGCNGRMGQVLVNEIDRFPELLLSSGFDISDEGKNTFPVYTNIYDIKEKPDVIIDFSIPAATFNILNYAVKENIPVVIATTGFTKEQLEEIKVTSTLIPIFQSSNMSFDINLMKKIVAEVALKLRGTDIEIVETHHNRKVDAPSGTAILLADAINEVMEEKLEYNFNRHDVHEKRNPKEIGFSSIRGGNIVGEHSVLFFGEHETFEIKHTSYSRNVFAEGALKAAIFIANQKPGYYGMDDMVK